MRKLIIIILMLGITVMAVPSGTFQKQVEVMNNIYPEQSPSIPAYSSKPGHGSTEIEPDDSSGGDIQMMENKKREPLNYSVYGNDNVVLLHLTSPEQAAAGYKGGEGWQLVLSMEISSANPDLMLFGTDTSGIWRSEDGGITWQSSVKGFDTIAAHAFAFDPDSDDVVFALGGSGVPDGEYFKPAASGIYRSGDGGKSWRFIKETKMTRRFSGKLIAFGVNEKGEKTIFAATQNDGLLYSRDGFDFSPVTALSGTGAISDIKIKEKTIVLATDNKGIMVSEDGGGSWRQRVSGIGASNGLKAVSVDINPADPEHWFCVANGIVYQSTDSGGHWTRLTSSDELIMDFKGVTLNKIAFSAEGKAGSIPRLYLYMNNTGYPLRVSGDYGETWGNPEFKTELAYNTENTGYYNEAFAVSPSDPDKIWTSWGGELYRSEDGGKTFVPSSSGYSGGSFRKLLFTGNKGQKVYLAAIDYGLSESVDWDASPGTYPYFEYFGGSRRTSYGGFSVHGIAIDPKDPGHWFISVGDWYKSRLKESFDGGNSWSNVKNGDIINKNSERMMLEYHPDDENFIYAGEYYSADNGKSWNKYINDISSHVSSPVNRDYIFAIQAQREVYISPDRGITWNKLGVGENKRSLFYMSHQILPDAADINAVWLCRTGYPLLRLTIDWERSVVTDVREYGIDAGFTATPAGTVSIWSVAQNPKNPLHFIAGGLDNERLSPEPGFFESLDGGETWGMVEGMEGSRDVHFIVFHPYLPQAWMSTTSGTWIYDYR